MAHGQSKVVEPLLHHLPENTMFGIKWQDKIPDTEVLTRANLTSIPTILMQTQLCWAGHVVRMPDHRLPKKLHFGELHYGRRLQGGLRMDRWSSSNTANEEDHDYFNCVAKCVSNYFVQITASG